MECRAGCGACCIAISISSPLPGMPGGKPAGVRCPHLTEENRCRLYGRPERPAVCSALRPSEEMCGHSTEEALAYLTFLERATTPTRQERFSLPVYLTRKTAWEKDIRSPCQ